jgi:transposase InsO family protein
MSAEHSVAQLCAALDVTRSGYHAWRKAGPSQRERRDRELAAAIAAQHLAHRGRYGAPRHHRELRARGIRCGGKRVARLMREKGLRASCPRRYVPRTTQSDHDQPIAPNRLAEARAPTRPDEIWVCDLTYVRTDEGWLYAAVVLDLYSRRVVGWSCSDTLCASASLGALRMALTHRIPARGLLLHSDRGVQYACTDHRRLADAAGLIASMSRPGNPYDNAAMESFMATYKRECVGLAGTYGSRAEAAADFFAYVELYYNRVRRHSALGYVSPVDFETQLN